MATGWSAAYAAAFLNGALKGTAWTPPTITTGPWLQLHLGDPGANGTSSVCATTARHQVTFTVGSTDGTGANNNTVTWLTTETHSETPTFWSLWTAATTGTFIVSGPTFAAPMVAGQIATFAPGTLIIEEGIAV